MELHWNYDYYQHWTNNKWIVEEILVIRNKANKHNRPYINTSRNILKKGGFGLDWTTRLD